MTTYCPGVPHEGHADEGELCPIDHPMHIYRARRAADAAERDLFAETEPRGQTPMGMLRRALTDDA